MSSKQAPWTASSKRQGAFIRKQSEFRDAISPSGRFAPAAGRYHLYVQYACPWAHRTLLTRALLGLEDAITVDVVSWRMAPDGSWVFDPDEPGATTDSLGAASSLQDVYARAEPAFDGIGTVPVLWDREHGTIVNNESREIVRMFDTALAPGIEDDGPVTSLLPEGRAAEVDAMIDANYEPINNGVYKCGFARSQDAYDAASDALFQRLDALEAHMEGRDWLVGDGAGVLTEADVCLWPTLLRFDPVYHTHFKCNRKLISQYPNLSRYRQRFYDLPGVAATVHPRHIKHHYYWSHTGINPHRIVPAGAPWGIPGLDAA